MTYWQFWGCVAAGAFALYGIDRALEGLFGSINRRWWQK